MDTSVVYDMTQLDMKFLLGGGDSEHIINGNLKAGIKVIVY